jgi:hypothetical protein
LIVRAAPPARAFLEGDAVARTLGSDGSRKLCGIVRCSQLISDAGFRQDVLGALRIGLNLLPELTHIDTQILRISAFVP